MDGEADQVPADMEGAMEGMDAMEAMDGMEAMDAMDSSRRPVSNLSSCNKK